MKSFLFGMVLILGAIQINAQPLKDSATRKKSAKIQYGTASWYSDKFNGRQTANGEIFSQKKMTCAHNSLPMGTWLRVTNIRNKRSIIVKVNDRLNAKNKRLVDLSRSGAEKLGIIKNGLAKVRVDVLGKNPPID
jgi:rare lipoprotein A